MTKSVSGKLKVVGWLAIGAMAGALTTVQVQAVARGSFSPLPLATPICFDRVLR
jgi:carboxyl-terminal processing protease